MLTDLTSRNLLKFIPIFFRIQISLIKTRFKKNSLKTKMEKKKKDERVFHSVESRLSAAHLNKADGCPSLVLRQLSTSVFGAFFCKCF